MEHVHAYQQHDHIAGVFPSRTEAEGAVNELRELGFGSPELGVAVRGPDPVAFERDAEAELEHDAGIGVGTGVTVGFLAGFALFGLAAPGLGTVGVGGLLALGTASGFGGAMLGGYLGVAAGDRQINVHEQLAATHLEQGEVLVAVCSHGRPGVVEDVLARHHGRVLLRPNS